MEVQINFDYHKTDERHERNVVKDLPEQILLPVTSRKLRQDE